MPANTTQQNILIDSVTPSSANWAADNLNARTANFGTNPFGSAVDSCQLDESAAAGIHGIRNTPTIQIVATGMYTMSCWLKPGTRNFAGFFLDFGVISFAALWNLTTGANTRANVFAGASSLFSTTVSVGTWETPNNPGWRLFFATIEVLALPPAAFFPSVNMSSDGTAVSYAGAIGQTIEVWNPQLVKANWPGQVTRTSPAAVNAAGALRNLETR